MAHQRDSLDSDMKIAFMACTRLFISVIWLSLVSAAPVLANTTEIPDLPRVTQPIAIDGKLDDDAWRHALQIDVNIETRPGENIPAKVKTIAYLLEDGESLFVAFDARDPDPSKIRAYLRDRDSAHNDDFVGIVIDSYNDHRRAFEFFSNPYGSQMDMTQDDVNQREDNSWDAIWDSAGQINDTGYVVEMEIPLNQLRFPSTDGKQTWGIDVVRFHPRENRVRISNNPMDREKNCYLCQISEVRGFEDLEPSRSLEIVPTVTASRTDFTDDPVTDPMVNGDVDSEAGVSVRWGIKPDLTASLAINPDFSQVEADVARLGVNNRFTLFFPEKRPFFLEGSDYFRTPIRAVFTRTVADPAVGAKLTGKRGDHTFGFYAADDAITNLVFPGSTGSDSDSLNESNTAAVGRYSMSFGNASSIGALVTARNGDDYHNYVGGLDARWKMSDNHQVRAQYLYSDTEYPDQVAVDNEQPLGAFGGSAAQLEYEYSSRSWFGSGRYEIRDEKFRADSGFVTRVDYDLYTVGGGHTWHGEEENWWNQQRVRADYDISHDTNGQLLERELEAYYSIDGPMQWFAQVGGLTRDVYLDGQVFREEKASLYTQFRPRGGLFLRFWARIGDQVDFSNTRLGDQVRIRPQVNWNINEHLLARLRSTWVKLDSKEGPNIFDAQVHDLRLTWQFNNRSFVRLTTQYRKVDRNPAMYIDEVDASSMSVGRQLLYSYKLNPQTVFFLGFSDRHIEDDDLDDLTNTDRTYFLKIGYAWMP
ncbi:MAG: carbohydrate binding family 9 domain-containing protein [Gammaproteobacteria bacterium]|nr:carbohydrate binding family 9 domain-containing protein [Gammaproteobacteria bacterium]